MKNSLSKIKVAVVGARGYAGLQLCQLLLDHPGVEISHLYSRDIDWKLSNELWHSKVSRVQTYDLNDMPVHDWQVIFFATPIEVSSHWIPKLVELGKTVIDLSGAHRFVGHATYGLVPWQNETQIAQAKLIANPGCYATSALMALLPLLKDKVIEDSNIVIDCKSGLSGAGRSANESLLLAEIGQDFYPYKVGGHQHVPEIQKYLSDFASSTASFQFATHLIPIERGICTSIYCETDADEAEIHSVFAKYYATYPYVHFSPWCEDRKSTIKSVRGNPMTHLRWKTVNGKLYLFSFIDNLMKGAASQAVENFNTKYQFHSAAGLASGANWQEATA